MSGIDFPNAELLVVDDQEPVRDVLQRILERAGYRCRVVASVVEAIQAIGDVEPDLVLCDIDMPEESGLMLVGRLHHTHPSVAVLMVTAFDDPDIAARAMDDGALGYVIKPFERNEILINVAAALRHARRAREVRFEMAELQRASDERATALQTSLHALHDATDALDRSHEQELRRLACAAEFRDPETACHLERMSRYAAALARAIGLGPERSEMIRLASPMHDVGKIGIPDEVLLKEGIFTGDDRRAMERHAKIGYDLLSGSTSPLLEMAATVAYTHHEWFDGTGYPRGLRGREIPIEGRIVAIADVYDALTSARRYKAAFAPATALGMMADERGTHFDPDLLDAFASITDELDSIRTAWRDGATAVA